MTKVLIFVSDSHADLERQLNEWLATHRCANVRFLQLATEGETAYAVLVA